MGTRITVQIPFGNVMLSFETDSTGTGLEDGLASVATLVKNHKRSLESMGAASKEWSRIRSVTKAPDFPVALASLRMDPSIRNRIVENVRRISFWDLVLLTLHYSSENLRYSDLMSISKEIGKPISYDWLNTELHRKRFRGLVRSEPIPGQKEKV